MSKIERLKRYSPALLRTGIAVVFLWFGFSQLKNPANWTRMMPSFFTEFFNMSAESLIYMNGTFEVVLATLLLLGLWTRVVSLFLGLHLLHITSIVGYGAVGARDLALALVTLSIFLNGADEFCLDKILKKKDNLGH